MYRPSKQHNFLEHFEEILSIIKSDQEIVILGDFNICCYLLTEGSSQQESLRILTLTRLLLNQPDLTVPLVAYYITLFSVGLSVHFLTYCTSKMQTVSLVLC